MRHPGRLITENIGRDDIAEHADTGVPAHVRRRVWTNCLVASSVLGFACDIVGVALISAAYFGWYGAAAPVNRIGTWLVICGIPPLFFASHCMDKIGCVRSK